jgi:hypothetical protein
MIFSTLVLKDDIIEFVEEIKIHNWRRMAVDRQAWKRIVEQAKTQKQF